MGNNAISHTKSKKDTNNEKSVNTSSPIIIILVIFTIIIITLYFLKDKIFKKHHISQSNKELAEGAADESIQDPIDNAVPSIPPINNKFEGLN